MTEEELEEIAPEQIRMDIDFLESAQQAEEIPLISTDNHSIKDGVSWYDKVFVTDDAGTDVIWATYKPFDHINWVRESFGEYNLPKINGMTIYYTMPFLNFRGFQPYYQNMGFKQIDEIYERTIDDGRQGRVTYMFADDEYIMDIQHEVIWGDQLTSFAVKTNKKTYGIPGRKQPFPKSIEPITVNADNRAAFVAFGGEYNQNTHFSQFYAYFIKLDDYMPEQ